MAVYSPSDQMERIRYYEALWQEAGRLLNADPIPEASAPELRRAVRELGEYYGSAVWKRDFADEEAGRFPKDLPRGVLSEDGIYNLMEKYGEWAAERIPAELFRLQDKDYAAFQAKLIPNIDPETIIGVRTPELRSMAKELKEEAAAGAFLESLPHAYFEENQLHAFLISGEKSFDRCIQEVEAFLPFIDNWATCDQLSPKVFARHTDELLPFIRKWMGSEETYTIRFGIGMLMQYYLDEHFDPEYPVMAAKIRSEEYYVNMMTAWYFATALAKQYESVLPYIENRALDTWTHNKAIQKCVESRRITPEQKEYLKTLKWKKVK